MILHHVLLAGAVALLGAAGVRTASHLSATPLERIVAAAALAATAATIHALVFGLVDLGTEPTVLCLAAAGTLLAAWRLFPRPAVSLGEQLLAAWEGFSLWKRAAAGALAGAVLAWTAWLLRYPAYDWDGLTYHIPEIVTWVREGSPGSIELIVPGWPYGNFPVTNEVLLSWGSGIARSFVWLTVWPALLLALLAASGWLGLRAVRVPPLPAALATASLCAAPLATSFQGNGPNTDFPALVWLVAAGALCAVAVSRDRPQLLSPALLAAALAVGTKTTAAPLAAIALGLALYRLRPRLRAFALPLALSAGACLVVGGTWYLRNLIDHGSPTWPFFPMPWGDPAPYLAHDDHTFFERPLESLKRFDDPGYVKDTFLGGLLIMASACIAPFLERSRAVLTAGAATALSVFLWSHAPDTGAPSAAFDYQAAFHASPRLLMPGVAVATLAVALAARNGGRRTSSIWTAVLALAVALNVWQLFDLGFPRVPTVSTPLAGAILGAVGALVAGGLPWGAIARPRGRALRGVAVASGVLAVGAVLGIAGSQFVDRHVRVAEAAGYAHPELVRWFDGPGADGRPIYSAPLYVGMLVGDDLSRKVEPIPRRAPCSRIEARARRGWVVLQNVSTDPLFGPSTTEDCVKGWRPAFEGGFSRVYRMPPSSAMAASER